MPQGYEEEDDWVEGEEEEDGSGDDLLVCPSCRNPVHEDTQQCPYCGDWIIPAWPERRTKRLVWIIAAILLIAAIVIMTVR